MSITHELLLSLGFNEVPKRPQRYAYKDVTGWLEPASGLFYFYGFSPAIQTRDDLQYMKMIIDYDPDTTYRAYPSKG